MNHLLTLFLCLSGFIALALATERQQQSIFDRDLSTRTIGALRTAGWGALGLALWVIVAWQGWGMGLVSYSGHTSLAAGLVYVGLILHGRRVCARIGTGCPPGRHVSEIDRTPVRPGSVVNRQ